jgi:hypothetical protein
MSDVRAGGVGLAASEFRYACQAEKNRQNVRAFILMAFW